MLNAIDQYRCYPTAENARHLQDLFERNPFRIWALQSEDLRVLTAAGVRAAELPDAALRILARGERADGVLLTM